MVFLLLNLMMIVDRDLNWTILNCQMSFLYRTKKKISIRIIKITLEKSRTLCDSVTKNSTIEKMCLVHSKLSTNFVSVIDESGFVVTVVPSLSFD